MGERPKHRRPRLARVALGSAVTLMMASAAVSCGDDGDAESGVVTVTDPTGVTVAGAGDPVNGEQLSRSQGCAGCHGQDFDGGAGPGWIGLAGSDVELADGSVVVADSAYLVRAISDPSAELVAGYNLRMPANRLSDSEIADIVAFIETLGG